MLAGKTDKLTNIVLISVNLVAFISLNAKLSFQIYSFKICVSHTLKIYAFHLLNLKPK